MISISNLWGQEGKTCYWCKRKTHVPKDGKKDNKLYSATREHLVPKQMRTLDLSVDKFNELFGEAA